MKKLKDALTRTIIFLILFLIWHIASVVKPGETIPAPLDVIFAMKLEYKVLLTSLMFTLKEALIGLLLSIALAYLFTHLFYLSPILKKAFTPIILVSQTIPFITLAPIIVLVFGYGFLPKVMIVILNCFFPMCMSLLSGIEEVNQDSVNLLKTMGANRNQIFRYVVSPSLRCQFFSGLKISVTYSIISAVIGEWMGGNLGIGIYITRAKKSYEMDKLIAAVILICFVSTLASKIVDLIQKKKLKKWSLTLFGLFSLLIVFSNEVKPESKDLSVIDFCLDYTPNTNHTGIYLADKLGFFREEGLKVNILQPPQDGASSLVASGKAQFGIDFQDQLTAMLESPRLSDEIKVTAAIVQHNTAVLISKKQNRLDDIFSLTNKKFAISSSPIDQKLFGVLTQNVKNLNFIITDATDVLTTLNTEIDVMCCYYGWDVIAAKKKNLDVNYLFYREINSVLDFYTPVIVSNKKFINLHPEVTRKFMRAVSRGYVYAIDRPEESAKILCEMVPELSYDLVLESQRYLSKEYLFDAKFWGYIDKNRWNAFYKWLFDNGITKTKIYERDVICNDYLPEHF